MLRNTPTLTQTFRKHKHTFHPITTLHFNTPQEQKQVFFLLTSHRWNTETFVLASVWDVRKHPLFPEKIYWHITKILLHAGEPSQLSRTRVEWPSNRFASSCVLSLMTVQWLHSLFLQKKKLKYSIKHMQNMTRWQEMHVKSHLNLHVYQILHILNKYVSKEQTSYLNVRKWPSVK